MLDVQLPKCSQQDIAWLKRRWIKGCFLNPVYTIQPVVKPVEQPVRQPAVSCVQTFNRLSNRLFNRGLTTAVEQPAASCKQTFNRLSNRSNKWFYNRLYRVNGALDLCSKVGK